MRLDDLKADFKERLVTALTLAPALSLILISAVYQLMIGSPYLLCYGLPLILGYVTFLGIIGSLLLGIIYRRMFTSTALSVIFSLCFLCNLLFHLNGTTDLLADGFFEMLMLAFSLPSWSYMSVASDISLVTAVPSLVITAVICVLCIASAVITAVIKKKEKTF